MSLKFDIETVINGECTIEDRGTRGITIVIPRSISIREARMVRKIALKYFDNARWWHFHGELTSMSTLTCF